MQEYWKNSPATMALIAINIAVYVLTIAVPDSIYYLGMYVPSITEGLFWTPLTHIFVHSGIMHLGMNMLSLLFLGGVLEPLFKTGRFVILYMLSGLVGSLFSMAFDVLMSGDMFYLGASGAIFGLFAAYGAVLLDMYAKKKKSGADGSDLSELRRGLASFAGLLVLNMAFSLTPGIGWQAHLGGFIGGGIISFAMLHSMGKSSSRK